MAFTARTLRQPAAFLVLSNPQGPSLSLPPHSVNKAVNKVASLVDFPSFPFPLVWPWGSNGSIPVCSPGPNPLFVIAPFWKNGAWFSNSFPSFAGFGSSSHLPSTISASSSSLAAGQARESSNLSSASPLSSTPSLPHIIPPSSPHIYLIDRFD